MLFTYAREAVRNLYAAKQRSLLALIGISIGIGAVIALVSIGIIWGEEMLRKFSELGPDLLNIEKIWGDKSDKYITSDDPELLLDYAHDTLAEVVPIISNYSNYRFNKDSSYVRIAGTNPSYKRINKLRLRSGRFISALDRNKPYIVIGSEVLQKPGFQTFTGNLVGASVKLNNSTYTVIGVLEKTFDWRTNGSVIIPISTAHRHSANNEISHIIARMNPSVHHMIAIEEIKRYFRRKKGMDIEIQAAEQLLGQIKEQAEMQTMLLGLISSISLLVGGVGIMNVMLTSVIDRRREIGILRAIGARQRDIRRLFLTEAVILSMIGGIIGAGLGILSSYIVCSYNGWQFFVAETAVWLGVGVSSMVGIFFGFYPAHKAAKLDPITALRSD